MPKILEATTENIKLCAEEIKRSSVVSFPTDTVYGLGANAMDEIGIKKIFAYKNRPLNKPLILHVNSIEQIEEHLEVNDIFYILAKTFLPGALTLILNKKKNSKISPLCSLNQTSQAFRIPNNKTCMELIKFSETPLVAPSANITGQISPTSAIHVLENFKEKDLLILDDKQKLLGLESTILNISNPRFITLQRYGAIPIDKITDLGIKIIDNSSQSIKLNIKTKIKLNATEVKSQEGLLGFGEIHLTISQDSPVLNLSEKGSLEEASQNLFSMLISLDKMNLKRINIMEIPYEGLGIAINDRLEKIIQIS